MADNPPPDISRGPGTKRGGTSGKVADFRYKRPARPDMRDTAARAGADAGIAKAFAPSRSSNHPHHRQAYAALDLGTNNCRLLIARPSGADFTVIDAFSRVVRLGEGLAASGRLSDEAMERTLAALHVCAEKLRRRNVRLARSVATEACRRAANGPKFIERVKQETGIVLDIISAQEEARLAVLGCHVLLEDGTGPAIIFDIGGGSTELVLVEPNGAVPRILDWMSVPWGVVSLTDTVPHTERTEEGRLARYAEMRRLVARSFEPFARRIAEHRRPADEIRLLGTSGTVTTLASLHLELPQYDRRVVDGLILPSQSMRDVSARLSRMSEADRRQLPCIGDDRANLVIAGCAILESILDIWPATQLGVADRGIREGILRSLIAADASGEQGRAALQRMREQDV
ncbi:Ppx/GppA phosphatase family protein [Qipengyuania sp. XHP0207]|uniref:Ppx/GppA phosphatase family protein n=1 Tax=Qipengyuania sp. XHP0207 TaxID=3038078 RepID=UPI00241BF1ED|nr:Ppx/GppA phosphatase family protein [Qipengyuania sp. XHP0207]MDG5746693.1 Ppx/GppA phosphatase family protein [Qipengyuania sp. XHP0207]